MDTKEHRLIFGRFNRVQRQNCRNERMNMPQNVEKKEGGVTREALDKRIHETNAKQRELIAKFQTNPKLYLAAWKKFTPEFNKAKFKLDAVQQKRTQYCRDYCGTNLDTEHQAISQLENIISKAMADAAAIENPTNVESTTVRVSQHVDVPAGAVTETQISLKNYTDITFDFDPVGDATVLKSVIDGRERAGAQTFGDLEKDGYTVTREKGEDWITIKSKMGFTFSYDQIKETTVENAINEVKEDISSVRDAVKNFDQSPKENPEAYDVVVRKVNNTVARSHDKSPEVGYAVQADIVDSQQGQKRIVDPKTGDKYDINRTTRDPENHHDTYELQAANKAVEALVLEENPALVQKTAGQLEAALNHLTDLVRNTQQNPNAVKNTIRTLDALLTYCQETGHNPQRPKAKSELQALLAKKREELVAWLPKTEKAPESSRFESYELMVSTLNEQRMDAARDFKENASRGNGVKLADIIKSQLYLMRKYKMNEKNTENPDFTHQREKLEAQLRDVKAEIAKYDATVDKANIAAGGF